MGDLGWSLARIAQIVKGKLVGPAHDLTVLRIVTDSRYDLEGAMFVALRGQRFNGHDFLTPAVDKGARSVLVEGPVDNLSVPQLVVANTLVALQELGAARRKEFSGQVIALTGSAGKTTTRRMLASVLARDSRVHEPKRNFNNHIGVPLTLLDIEKRHQVAVLELGCSGFGEIELLTRLCDPDLALITNVGPAHLEQLGSLSGVARAKGELFEGLRPEAQAVVNLDDPHIAVMPTAARKKVTFGESQGCDVTLIRRIFSREQGQTIEFRVLGNELTVQLSLPGAHNARNALAAAAVAAAVGCDGRQIAAGLAAVSAEPGRLFLRSGRNGSLIVDDSYNANPASMRAAIEALFELADGRNTIAALGDMLELGQASESAHLSLGAFLSRLDLGQLVTTGPGGQLIAEGARSGGMDPSRLVHTTKRGGMVDAVLRGLRPGVAVLVKGSRGMRMDEVVSALAERKD